MTEAQIVQAIRRRWDILPGAYSIKLHGGRFQAPGLPDILLFRRGATFLLEVKRPGKRPTAKQTQVMQELRARAGIGTGWATSAAESWRLLHAAGMLTADECERLSRQEK